MVLTGCYWGIDWDGEMCGSFVGYRLREGSTGVLGRPEWKMVFGGYRGERGVQGCWGDRNGIRLLEDTEGQMLVQMYWGDRSGRKYLEGLGIIMMKLLKLILKK